MQGRGLRFVPSRAAARAGPPSAHWPAAVCFAFFTFSQRPWVGQWRPAICFAICTFFVGADLVFRLFLPMSNMELGSGVERTCVHYTIAGAVPHGLT